jgi:crotonobetainyl-CoA:carnitine CoA-transferase CaiB-like acyl-CoA transferase
MAPPLAGTRVLEAASYITGPYTAQLLADLGAQVIKLEDPRRGDPFRAWAGDLYGPDYLAYNRGKQSLTLDLRSPASREILDRLIPETDVLIENFRPGVAGALGIGWDRVRDMNPGLVYCSISGLGPTGPAAHRPVYDSVGIALSGLLSTLTDLGEPRLGGPAFGDCLTGLYACYGVCGALLARQTTGRGQLVEVNMLSATLGFLLHPAAWHFATGQTPERLDRPRVAQAYAFGCADGKAFVIHLSTPPKFWEGLTEAAGCPELRDDPRFATRDARVTHYEDLRQTLAAIFRTRPRAHWLERLEHFDVPHAPVHTVDEALAEPQARHLGIEIALEHPARGRVRSLAPPVTLSDTPVQATTAPPTLGEHTGAILARLGYDTATIERLRTSGVI